MTKSADHKVPPRRGRTINLFLIEALETRERLALQSLWDTSSGQNGYLYKMCPNPSNRKKNKKTNIFGYYSESLTDTKLGLCGCDLVRAD